MDPKLALLFMLIGTIVGLAHATDGSFTRLKRFATARRRRAASFRRG